VVKVKVKAKMVKLIEENNMSNIGLSRFINESLNLEWMLKKYGLVFSNTINMTKDPKSRVTLPFQYGTQECTNDNAVCWKTGDKSISWIECGPTTTTKKFEGVTNEKSNEMRIVCWMDTRFINHEDDTIGEKCQNQLVRKLSSIRHHNHNQYGLLRVNVRRAVTDAKLIIGKYGFTNEKKNIFHPYYLFAVDFTVTYTKDCAPVIMNPKC
jgi:hypothetical protein